MKYDVFISYSSKDQKVVEAMCAYLEQHKIRCFVAFRDIPKGVVWAKAIVEALDESEMMVVVFSEDFNLSDQVDRELELASEDKKPILTFRISDTMFQGVKKYYLKNINWIDAFPHPEQVFDTLLDNICKLLGKQRPADNAVPQESSKHDSVRRDIPESTELPGLKVGVKVRLKGVGLEGVAKKVYISSDGKEKCMVDFGDGNVLKKRVTSLELVLEKTWKVGDYYNVDGKDGVVFWVDETGKHGKIVSLDQAELQWCTRNEYEKGLTSIAVDNQNGMKNQQSVMNLYRWRNRSKYPAFGWCSEHGKDWYLPAKEELGVLLLDDSVRDVVNDQIKCLGKTKLEGEHGLYWSSTEKDERCAWVVYTYDGCIRTFPRHHLGFVRAVSAF